MADQAKEPASQLTAEDAGRIDPARRVRLIAVLAALVLYSELAVMQIAMVSVAIPKVAASFPAEGATVTWIVTISGVVGGATLALVGKLGDLVGKKKVGLLAGVLVLVGTLIDALTSNWGLFLFGRALGGLAAAIATIEYGLVRDLMPRKWIPVAVGVVGTGFGIGSVVSPLIVGALTDHYSWRSVFWFLLIYLAVTTPVFAFVVPETPVRTRQRLDILGAVLLGTGIAAVLVYVSEGSSWGWGTMSCLAYLLAGLALLAAFLAWEQRAPEPIMELSLLRRRGVAIPMAASFFFVMAMSTIAISVNYIFQTPTAAVLKSEILAGAAAQAHLPVSALSKTVSFRGDISYANGYSILGMVLHITIWTSLFVMIFGVVGGWMCRRVGSRLPLIIAGASMAVASALWVEWHSTWEEQVLIGLLFGIGGGFYYASTPNLLMDDVPTDRQGVSSGMSGVFGSVGASVGSAVFTAIIAAHPFQVVTSAGGHLIARNVPNVYTDTAYSLNYVVVGIVPAVATLLIALALRTGRTPARGGASAASPIAEASVAGAAGSV